MRNEFLSDYWAASDSMGRDRLLQVTECGRVSGVAISENGGILEPADINAKEQVLLVFLLAMAAGAEGERSLVCLRQMTEHGRAIWTISTRVGDSKKKTSKIH